MRPSASVASGVEGAGFVGGELLGVLKHALATVGRHDAKLDPSAITDPVQV